MLAKLIRYDNQAKRTEKSSVMVADRGFEGFSEALQSNLPGDVKAVRIDRSALTDAEMRESDSDGA